MPGPFPVTRDMTKLLKASVAVIALGVLLAGGNASALELKQDPQVYDACIKDAWPKTKDRSTADPRDVILEIQVSLYCSCLVNKYTGNNIGAVTFGEMVLQLAKCKQEDDDERFYWCGDRTDGPCRR
jgi:hypothetical protein